MTKSIVETEEIVLSLQKVVKEKKLSLEKLNAITIERNKEDPNFPVVSKTTLSRIFRKGGEKGSYNYNNTLHPLASILLDVNDFTTADRTSAEALMTILHFKKELIDGNTRRIESLENELELVKASSKDEVDKEKIRYHAKLEKEMAKFQRSLDFTKEQISLKDKRIDELLSTIKELIHNNSTLTNQLLQCPCRTSGDIKNES